MTTTPAPLTSSERNALDAALRARQRELRADVAAKLKTQDDPRLVGLRNQMEDTDDWAAADAAAAQDIALVSRDLAELANVEAALVRVADGTYGECEDCGAPSFTEGESEPLPEKGFVLDKSAVVIFLLRGMRFNG